MNSKQQKTLEAIFSNPTNGNLPWSLIENLFVAGGCRIIEGQGSSITVEKDGVRAYFHRPHPQKEALRYRVRDAREFLTKIGVKP
ncbi:MAG: type II toxin-antitoxin system HicA family toxin [Methylococcus sp.]|nr:MAG: type II toxin-antitoxin system HicA family toxin [Methylococcus sp.]